MAREQSLETFQDQVATFRRRTQPDWRDDHSRARIANALDLWGDNPDTGRVLGEMLIDLCCLAQAGNIDLAFHARRAFRRRQDEYEAGR